MLKSFLQFFRQAHQLYPIEFSLSTIFALALIVIIPRVEHYGGIVIFFPFYFAFTYLFHNSRYYYFTLLYPLIGTLWILWFNTTPYFYLSHSSYWGALLIHLIFFLVKKPLENNHYLLKNIFLTSKNLFLGIIFGGAFCFLILLLLLSTKLIFALETIADPLFSLPFALFLFGSCLFFLFFEQKNIEAKNKQESEFIIDILNEFLSLGVIGYSILVYTYLLMILSSLELPKERVAYIIIPYIVLGLICQALLVISSNNRWKKFYDYFHIFATIPLIIVWFAIYERLSQYGLTPTRIYLITIATLLSLFILFSFSKKLLQYRLFNILIIVAICLLTMIISPEKISQNNQIKRFEQLLFDYKLVDQNKKIIPLALQTELGLTAEQVQQMQNVYSHIIDTQLLDQRYGKENIEQIFTNPSVNPVNNTTSKINTYLTFSRYDYVYLNSVNIERYSHFVPLQENGEFNFFTEENVCQFADATNITLKAADEKNIFLIDKNYFKQIFEQYNIDMTQLITPEQQKHWPASIIPKLLHIPTKEGGLLLLENIRFEFVQYSCIHGYLLKDINVIGYLQPKQTTVTPTNKRK